MVTRLGTPRGRHVLGELLMLVVGINIALWFEGQFDDLRDRQAETVYLQGLRDDLARDLSSLDVVIEHDRKKIERLRETLPTLPVLAAAPGDEQSRAVFEPSGYRFFEPSDFTYRGMQESGDFHLLSDPAIKEGILRLVRHYRMIETLQQNFLQALDDEYIPLLMRHFDLVANRIADPAVLDNLMFRNFYAYALQDTAGRTKA